MIDQIKLINENHDSVLDQNWKFYLILTCYENWSNFLRLRFRLKSAHSFFQADGSSRNHLGTLWCPVSQKKNNNWTMWMLNVFDIYDE